MSHLKHLYKRFLLVLDTVTWRPSRRMLFHAGGWFLYGLVIFVAVFVLNVWKVRLGETIREKLADSETVQIDFPYVDIEFFPLRAKTSYIHIVDKHTGKPYLLLGDTRITVSLLSLLVGDTHFSLESRAYGGKLTSEFSIDAFSQIDEIDMTFHVDMVELQEIPQVQAFDPSLTGFMTADASLRGKWAAPLAMEGQAAVRGDQLNMENRIPIVDGNRLEQGSLNLEFSMSDGKWTFSDMTFRTGDGIVFEGEGVLVPNPTDRLKSSLDLRAAFTAPVARVRDASLGGAALAMLRNGQPVPLVVTGLWGKPKISTQ